MEDAVMMHYLMEIGRSFRAADLLDIFIIFALIYVVLVWFKRTASRFVLIGISILGLIYILARFFGLYLTVFILQGFFAILVIALVIIFQEDLRRFFERVATWGIIRKKRVPLSPHKDISVLAQTVRDLVQEKVGALIVLKGNDYLHRHLKGGIALEGKLSEALLESLFDPHSKGHDGAVVIENGQVSRFGCHLPLSSKAEKTGNLGLRHSAALGLAERSDALCIVVSEERGTITVARNGGLKELNSVDQLRSVLKRFYQKKSPGAKKTTWFNWVRENPREKVIAILLACGMWLVFGYQRASVRRDFIVPVEYRNLPSYWLIEEPKPKEVTITLMGSEQAFDLLNPQLLKISLDMSRIQEGKQEFVLEGDWVRHPSNLSVVGIEPGKIPLIAYQMVPLNVPIKVQTSGGLSPGLSLRRILVTPKSVQVMVPSQGKRPVEVLTEPLDLQSVTATLTLRPRLVLPPDVRFLNGKAPNISVTIEVEEGES